MVKTVFFRLQKSSVFTKYADLQTALLPKVDTLTRIFHRFGKKFRTPMELLVAPSKYRACLICILGRFFAIINRFIVSLIINIFSTNKLALYFKH